MGDECGDVLARPVAELVLPPGRGALVELAVAEVETLLQRGSLAGGDLSPPSHRDARRDIPNLDGGEDHEHEGDERDPESRRCSQHGVPMIPGWGTGAL